jgi:hypothetical protein
MKLAFGMVLISSELYSICLQSDYYNRGNDSRHVVPCLVAAACTLCAAQADNIGGAGCTAGEKQKKGLKQAKALLSLLKKDRPG